MTFDKIIELMTNLDNDVSLEKLERFEKDANEMFINMNDDIQNEIIAYSINPNLKFGSYVIKSYDGEERNHEIHY